MSNLDQLFAGASAIIIPGRKIFPLSKFSVPNQAQPSPRLITAIIRRFRDSPEVDALRSATPPAVTAARDLHSSGRQPAGNCERIRDLGYTSAKHMKMYGERFELVSDPIEDGDYTVVQVISGSDPTIRTLRLPISILLGLSDRSGQKTKFGKRLR